MICRNSSKPIENCTCGYCVPEKEGDRLVRLANRRNELRELYNLFCLPEFNVDKVYWAIYTKENRG